MTTDTVSTSTGQSAVLHVWVVEDDVELRDAIILPALRASGHVVRGIGTVAALYADLLSDRPDLMVLDIALPDGNGFEVARRVREVFDPCIIMLTGSVDSESEVRGLDVGADAYLGKPVEMSVLCATIRSVARRLGTGPKPVPDENQDAWLLEGDGWYLRTPCGASVELGASERVVMKLLIENRSRPVCRDALMCAFNESVDAADPHRLDMLVYRLRRKVEKISSAELPLRTVRGVGYVWTGSN